MVTTSQLPESTQYLTRNFSRPVVVALARVSDSLVEYEHMDHTRVAAISFKVQSPWMCK